MNILVFVAVVSLATADRRPPRNGYGAPPPVAGNGYGNPAAFSGYDDPLAALAESIPGGGVPGVDYPILASVPDTGFDCDAQDVQGYYADTDPEAGCQVFHICQDRALRRQKDSFLCPNGTIFNQEYLVCDWWFNFDCADAEDFYSVNELIGVIPYGKPKNNGYGGSNGDGSNGYGGSNGRNGKKNGNGRKSSGAYGAPTSPVNGYGAPPAPSNAYGSPL
ncbi:hypothetical protein SK128_023728 [Halocaridina rubra]|uniref:Chitin-binding type-2 domain-containing protein n=1 Tax=Halocaridina rubra TaxID=373956 RepID=A0AAN8X9V3_HALRR